ncbi:MAG: energy-coupling factor ABC transporter ATP-binding protein [Thermoproteaceae archaeon]|nr:energy-coupling factor ABC transporter ATP-binding protein [Thermoproteaceae archaeon]
MRREVLRAVSITFGYYSEPVLLDASLDAREGEVVAVTGPTGSGKTTLLMVLAGLLRPWSGEVYFMGRPVWERLPEARRHIGVMFQNPDDMFFNATVLDEIAYTAVRAYGPEAGLKMARRAAEELGISHLLDRPPYRLSGGQKRLVALAAAAAHGPRLLLLDEPTTYLDEELWELAASYIARQRERGVSIVIATHDLELICRLADRTYALRGGRLSEWRPGRKKLCICGL